MYAIWKQFRTILGTSEQRVPKLILISRYSHPSGDVSHEVGCIGLCYYFSPNDEYILAPIITVGTKLYFIVIIVIKHLLCAA